MLKKGFSLIELVVALAIVGLLAIVSTQSYEKYSSKSKRSSIKPSLLYIYNLFNLNYIDQRHFGGVRLVDVSLPENYCLKVFSGRNPQPQPQTIGNCRSGVPTRCNTPSGFVAIAYGKKPILDIGINHNEEIKEGAQATCSHLKGKSCASYTEATPCRKAGCRWLLNNCDQKPI